MKRDNLLATELKVLLEMYKVLVFKVEKHEL